MTRQLGLGLLLVALLFGFHSSKLMMGTIQDPGPGWFPFWLSMIMVPLSLRLILAPPVLHRLFWPWKDLVKVMLAVLVMACVNVAGLWICSFVSMMIMRNTVLPVDLTKITMTMIVTTVLCILMTEIFALQLPLWPR